MSAEPASPKTADGYIVDVAYPAHFQREIMPVWLASTLTALGRRAPDLARPYTWLELGCGAGLAVLVAAATHPAGRFIGIDFSAREIERAQQMARRAGLANAQFVCQSLEDAAGQAGRQDRPDCDFIVTNGVYSWIGEANRNAIDRIVRHRLKPGGAAYVAYMSHPGAASFGAAQKLLLMATRRHPGNSADRARAGIDLLQRLAGSGAGYFAEHPAALRDMEQVSRMGDAYLAHEFLNDEWHVLHVADVMRRYAEAGCEYAGSATLLENIDAVSLPANVLPLLAQLQRQGADAAQLETAKDIARNQNLRRDLYQKAAADGAHRLADDQHRAALLAQRVMLLPAAPERLDPQGELRLSTRIGPVAVSMQQVHPLVTALRQGPLSYAELARLPAYARNPGFINQLLQILAWNGWLHFMPPAPAAGAPGQAGDATRRLRQVLAESGYPGLQPIAAAGTALLPDAGPKPDRRSGGP